MNKEQEQNEFEKISEVSDNLSNLAGNKAFNYPEQELSWEKQFDEEFEDPSDGYHVDYGYIPRLKRFISQNFIPKSKVEEVVEGMKKDAVFVPDHNDTMYGGLICRECGGQEDCDCNTYNQALQDLKSKLLE